MKHFTPVPLTSLRDWVSGSNTACLGSCQGCCGSAAFISSILLDLERRVVFSGSGEFKRGAEEGEMPVSAIDGMVATLSPNQSL